MYIVLCQMKRKSGGSYWQLWYLYQVSTSSNGEKYKGVEGGGFTLCNNNNKMKEILPQTRHTIRLYGDKTWPFFLKILIYLFLNTMSALEINHVFTHDAFYYKWRKISAWIYITLGFTFISTLKVTRSLSLSLVSSTMPSLNFFFVFVFFLVSCRIGYMKQPGRLSLAQSHICAHGCRRVMPAGGRPESGRAAPPPSPAITARLLQIHIETNR